MITQILIYESTCLDPYANLATEKHLMDITPPGCCTLYLWQNQNTVVIGRNQNAWLECRHTLLAEEGGRIARRLSGGGAVFHDSGNLNFTFLMRKEDYDLDKQLSVIQKACEFAGIQAIRSGRNDLLADDRKFSGNAFYQNQTHAYHHGTLMVDVDKERLGRYLSPPKAKLMAKGVASVRSRVVNLKELAPALTIDSMKQHMVDAFAQVYGLSAEPVSLSHEDYTAIEQLQATYGSWEYLFGTPLPFTVQCEDYFSWGFIQLQIDAKDGVINTVKVYSDALDWNLPQTIQQALTGCRFEISDIQASLNAVKLDAQIFADLCGLLRQQCS